ncbi:MAG: hypothetical protein ACKO37_03730 [Vampirovibrionales bacterium]
MTSQGFLRLFHLHEGNPTLSEVLPLWWKLTTWTWLIGTLQALCFSFTLVRFTALANAPYKSLLLLALAYIVYTYTEGFALWMHWHHCYPTLPWRIRLTLLVRYVLGTKLLEWFISVFLLIAVILSVWLGVVLLQTTLHARLPISELPLNEALLLVLLLALPFGTLGHAFVLRWVMRTLPVAPSLNESTQVPT